MAAFLRIENYDRVLEFTIEPWSRGLAHTLVQR